MTNRVLLGDRSGGAGLFVSKPGVDVVTAVADDLLLSTSIQAFQIVQTGSHSDPGASSSFTASIPNLGFTPLVLVWCDRYLVGYSVSGTTLTVNTGIKLDPTDTFPVSGLVSWAVTNIPQPA
jgi:hypothetical protein